MKENKFETHSKIWDENAKTNSHWAVLSDPEGLTSGFNDGEFFNSGVSDVSVLLDKIARAYPALNFAGVALDFGCGIGRLSAALAKKFASVVGLDISNEMIRQAHELTRSIQNITFKVNERPDLKLVESGSIAFLLSLIVVQHIPPPYSFDYLKEFARVLAPGGVLVVQIPTNRVPTFKNVVRQLVPEKIFRLKHAILKSKVPYVTMFGIPENKVRKLFIDSGLKEILVEPDTMGGTDWNSRTYIFKK